MHSTCRPSLQAHNLLIDCYLVVSSNLEDNAWTTKLSYQEAIYGDMDDDVEEDEDEWEQQDN